MDKIIKRYGCSKPLIVTDEVLVSQGLVKMCTDSLDGAGLKYVVYDKGVPNPHSELVGEGFELYKKEGCDGLIAFGGGSPMDACKMIGAKVANPKPVEAYHGAGKIVKPIPPLIAVPTTAGTASETSPGAVITLREKQAKIVVVDKVLIPKVAVLDPNVLIKLPKPVTAATGMDALTHAVESYLSIWKTKQSRNLSLLAVEKIFRNLARTYEHGDDIVAREEMLVASFSAGRAFSRASLGYVHGVAHQFGGLFHTPHGVANAMVLPHVLDAYAANPTPGILADFEELCIAAGLASKYKVYTEEEKKQFPHMFIRGVRELHAKLELPRDVPDMRREHVDSIVKRAVVESHGETAGTFPGYPTPINLSVGELTKIVCACLPQGQQQQSKL